MKIVKSTVITHGADYGISSGLPPAVTNLSLTLKSRWDGDKNPIRGAYLRAIRANTNNLSTTFNPIDASTQAIALSPRRRPPLMHSLDGGIDFNGSLTPSETFFVAQLPDVRPAIISASMLIKPNTTTTITCGASVLTMTNSSGSFTPSVSNGTAYLNGAAWSGAQRFPFPRLVTFTFSVARTDALVINGSGVVSEIVTMTADPDEALYAQMLYRKPISSQVVTDSAAIGAPTDNLVTVPETWNVVESN